MKLYQHQSELLSKNPARSLIAWSTGTGKSRIALELANKNQPNRLLIICPKALKENWQRHVTEFRYGLPVRIMSKEEFKRDHVSLAEVQAIILDEAHYFANYKSQLSKSLEWYCRKWNPKFRWLLTATPYLSTPMNIFSLARHLGHFWNYQWFFKKFFNQVRMGQRLVPVVKKNIEGEIAKLVQGIGTTAKLEDLIDVPEQVFETEYFELTWPQKKAISRIEMNETTHVTRFTKIHQAEQGAIKESEYEPRVIVESDKNERIIELCHNHDKVAIFCRYNLQIEILRDLLQEAGFSPLVINGENKARDATVQIAESMPRAVVLIQAACSEGYELSSFGIIIFASLDFSYKNYAQSLGRFLRINKPKKNVYIHLITKGGVDSDVYDCIMKKQDFNLEIYERGRQNYLVP